LFNAERRSDTDTRIDGDLPVKALHVVDYVVIGLYFAALVGIGLWSVRKTRNRDDYLVAGRRLGFPLFFGCMSAMAVGGAVTVGGTGKGYSDGIAGMWVGGSLGMGLILLGMLVSNRLSRLRALSINEVIERNYGAAARVFGAILTIIYTVALTVVQVVSMGAITAGLFGISLRWAMFGSGLVVVFYTFLGGMWSVTMTDIVQFVIKTLGVLIFVPIVVLNDSSIGGISGFIEKVPESHWNLGAYGVSGTVYWILLYVPGLVIGQDIWQRMFTARTPSIARAGTLSAGAYTIVYSLAAVVLGMSVRAAGIQLDDPSMAFEAGVSAFLPPGIAGLLLAAALAASMSVASGTILACSTVVYNDLYVRFIRGHGTASADPHDVQDAADSQRDAWINRGIALVVGLAIIGLSLLIGDLFKALDLAYGFLSGCVFVPVIFSFVLKRISPKSGFVSLVASAITVGGTMVFGEATNRLDFAVGGNWPITFGIGVGLVAYLLVMAVDRTRIVPNVEIEDEPAAVLEAEGPASADRPSPVGTGSNVPSGQDGGRRLRL
jgi:SSS family solute:Na+ symporter